MNAATDLRLGYLVPEFPSQTHIFFQRGDLHVDGWA